MTIPALADRRFVAFLGELLGGDGEVQVLTGLEVEGRDAEQVAAGVEQAAAGGALRDRRRGLDHPAMVEHALGRDDALGHRELEPLPRAAPARPLANLAVFIAPPGAP